MTIIENGGFLTNLFFVDQKYVSETSNGIEKETDTILKAKEWLDIYFSGKEPSFVPKMLYGSSPFQKVVLDLLLKIPYGSSRTYGDIAKDVATILNKPKISSQAVGNAISHNPICLIIPCHRVLGKNNALVGYAGGIERKEYLLNLERVPHKNG